MQQRREVLNFLDDNGEKINLEIDETSPYWENSSVSLEDFMRFKESNLAVSGESSGAGSLGPILIAYHEDITSSVAEESVKASVGNKQKVKV